MTKPSEQVTQLHRQAQKAMASGDLKACHQHCLAVLKIDPDFADAWFLCGVIAGENGLREKAVQIFGNAIRLDPNQAEYHAELGKYLLALEQPEQALAAARAAEQLKPSGAPLLNTLATLLSHCGEHASALVYFAKAGELVKAGRAPTNPNWIAEFYFNWGASLQFDGDFDVARGCLEKAIEHRPDYFRAHFALSSLDRQTPQSNHIDRLIALKPRASSPRDRLHVGHALAKEQEDLEDYAGAFKSLEWAKSAHRAATGYDFAEEQKLFEHIKAHFDAQWFRATETDSNNSEPIFIVGMPRTGTTLVEQILSSHSQVFAAGELQNFPLQLRRWVGGDPGPLNADDMDTAARQPVAGLGHNYIESTRPRTGHTPRFIDKLPLNFLYLGLIHKALPNAKLICLRRDPMDVCLSNYRQLFASNFAAYRYNLDLEDCGRYYIEFDHLMRHWHDSMPGQVLDVRYESVVTDTEDEVRRLLEFCDLPFEQACLAPHAKKTSVATPSAVQVRQKIYTSSVERWRRYGDAMQPLHDLLKAAGYY